MSTQEGLGLAKIHVPSAPTVARDRLNLTILIAWRNLVHDRLRFAVTLVGIAFTTILVGVQLGLLLNFVNTVSTIVDHAGADLWIAAQGVRSVDLATPIEARRRFQALSVDGVAKAESYLLHFGFWKRGVDGNREIVIIVGVEPNAEMGLPWAMTSGESVRDALASPDGILIDRIYAEKLGVKSLNQVVEINNHRARVVGFTDGIRTFTQSPYVFTSLRNAQSLLSSADNGITYVLIQVAKDRTPEEVARALSERMPDIDVLQSRRFSRKSQDYWLMTTGAGVSLVSSSILALLVGAVVVAQTLYASTMDRLPEYAVIRAMGGPRSYLYKIVIQQAVFGGALGGAIGIAIVLALAHFAKDTSAPPIVPPWLVLGIGIITVATCIAASLVSLSKITAIDPVKVFR
ncbi:MAG: ABC transporter permease [Methylocystis sp.]